MPGHAFDGQEQTECAADAADATPPCVALVPIVAPARWSQVPSQLLLRADPTFVTHLIATAEHVPQTCSLRRATPADAQAAYRSATDQTHPAITGIWTRQTS